MEKMGKRRQFSAEYKRAILAEADAATEPGAIGALLHREGLYASHLASWRKARMRGELDALAPKKRGPKPSDPRDGRIAELERALLYERIQREQADRVIAAQRITIARLNSQQSKY